MNIFTSKDAAKAIDRLDAKTQEHVKKAVEGIPKGDIRPLEGYKRKLYRLRVGGIRVIFSYQDADTILVERVSPRGDAYKGGL